MSTFPQRFIWYPGSAADVFPAVLSQLVLGDHPPAKGLIDTTLPVVLNDFDPGYFRLLTDAMSDTVIYRDGRFLLFPDQHYARLMRSNGIQEVTLRSVTEHKTADAYPELDAHTLQRVSAVMPSWLEIDIDIEFYPDSSISPKQVSRTLYFIGSDAFRFYDTVVPVLNLEIHGLIMLRMGTPASGGRREGVSADLIGHLESIPEQFRKIAFGWFDRSVHATNRWKEVDTTANDLANDDDGPANPGAVAQLHTLWVPTPYIVPFWGSTLSKNPARLFLKASIYHANPKPQSKATYWVLPGQFLAGEWPSEAERESARLVLAEFLDTGVRTFMNLVPESELGLYSLRKPYYRWANALARELRMDIVHLPFAFPDMTVPESSQPLRSMLETLTESAIQGRPVYVHCAAGLGRTGVVVGSWLAYHKIVPPAEAVQFLNFLRYISGDDMRYISPQNELQQNFVLDFKP